MTPSVLDGVALLCLAARRKKKKKWERTNAEENQVGREETGSQVGGTSREEEWERKTVDGHPPHHTNMDNTNNTHMETVRTRKTARRKREKAKSRWTMHVLPASALRCGGRSHHEAGKQKGGWASNPLPPLHSAAVAPPRSLLLSVPPHPKAARREEAGGPPLPKAERGDNTGNQEEEEGREGEQKREAARKTERKHSETPSGVRCGVSLSSVAYRQPVAFLLPHHPPIPRRRASAQIHDGGVTRREPRHDFRV